jgi:cell division protein FtsI/penicillin-binding protein 2
MFPAAVPIERPPASVRIAMLVALLLAVPVQASAQGAANSQLFAQAAKASLDRNFASPAISYLLLDESGNVVAQRWRVAADREPLAVSELNSAQTPVSPGSLVKPFLAMAYGEQHGGEFPKVHCLGTRSRCWLPAGHGTLELEEAIAQSCNAYFLELAAGLDRTRAGQTFARYGLAGPDAHTPNESLAGLGTGWRETPLALARAYLKLAKERQHPIQGRIAIGMLDSAMRGTARAVDAVLGGNAALAKTGTAVCSHTPRGAADGFAVVLYPAAQPRLLLLVRVHGITGAESAKVAGAMLRSLEASER